MVIGISSLFRNYNTVFHKSKSSATFQIFPTCCLIVGIEAHRRSGLYLISRCAKSDMMLRLARQRLFVNYWSHWHLPFAGFICLVDWARVGDHCDVVPGQSLLYCSLLLHSAFLPRRGSISLPLNHFIGQGMEYINPTKAGLI